MTAPTLVGTVTAGALDGGNPVGTLPVSIAAGDLVFMFGGHARFANGASILTAGYTNGTKFGSSTAPGRAANYGYKLMGGTPDASVTCEGSGDAQDAVSYVGHVYSGVDQVTPLDATPATTNGGTSGVPNSPAITTVTADAIVLSYGLSRQLDVAVTAPAGYGNLAQQTGDDTTDITAMGADITVASPGSEDPGAWSGIAVNGHCSMTAAIRPAAASGYVPPPANTLMMMGVGI